MSEVKKKTGFALLTPEKRREMGASGGKTAHARGTARVWSPDEARAQAARIPNPTGSFTSESAREAQKKSGTAFTAETGRLASEKRHDERMRREPGVEWWGES